MKAPRNMGDYAALSPMAKVDIRSGTECAAASTFMIRRLRGRTPGATSSMRAGAMGIDNGVCLPAVKLLEVIEGLGIIADPLRGGTE